jgi:hypothetical protein
MIRRGTREGRSRESSFGLALHGRKDFTVGIAGVGSGEHITAEYVSKVLARANVIHTPRWQLLRRSAAIST